MMAWLLTVALAAPSPHGSPDGCPACHDPVAEVAEVEEMDELDSDAPAPVGPARPAIPTCLGCHPTADMHPVGVRPVTTRIPETWPLEDGAVTCATCHDEPGHADVDPALPSPYHREGPYPSTLALCARCHDLGELVRVDPHHATSTTPREDAGCAACHTSLPEEGAAVADARLRTQPDQLCALCHEGPVHHGTAGHLGQPVSVAWPTWPPGQMACYTCHDVHDGVAGSHRAGPLAQQLQVLAGLPPRTPGEHSALLVLSLDALCPACHGVGP